MPETYNDDKSAAPPDANDQSPEGAVADENDPQAVIEGLRKRQAGADKAKAAAIAERDALQARLDALTSQKPASKSDDGTGTVDVEALKRELQAEFETELANRTKAQQATFLDAQFPEARKRFPEVTDPVKLTELESVFGEAPKPIGNNAAKAPGQKSIDDMSIAELRNSLDGQLGGALGRS